MPDPVAFEKFGARLFAVALRITGEKELAARALEEAFVGTPSSDEPSLLRAVRDCALSLRRAGAPRPAGTATPRQLVEEAFFGGRRIDELSAIYGLPAETVRSMLRDGMAQLRSEVGVRVSQ